MAADNITISLFGECSDALFSECGSYRYWLSRDWADSGPVLGWLMLNPSSADHLINDQTITRCIRRAATLGFSGIRVVNMFAWRSSDPVNLLKTEDPVGPLNDRYIVEILKPLPMVIGGWGSVHPSWRPRIEHVTTMLRQNNIELHALALTKDGQPRHPLYLPYNVSPQPWRLAA